MAHRLLPRSSPVMPIPQVRLPTARAAAGRFRPEQPSASRGAADTGPAGRAGTLAGAIRSAGAIRARDPEAAQAQFASNLRAEVHATRPRLCAWERLARRRSPAFWPLQQEVAEPAKGPTADQ